MVYRKSVVKNLRDIFYNVGLQCFYLYFNSLLIYRRQDTPSGDITLAFRATWLRISVDLTPVSGDDMTLGQYACNSRNCISSNCLIASNSELLHCWRISFQGFFFLNRCLEYISKIISWPGKRYPQVFAIQPVTDVELSRQLFLATPHGLLFHR